MSDKQPLIGAQAPPPPYAPQSTAPPGAAAYPPPQAPPPAYSHPQQQPSAPPVYGTTTHNITVVQARPIATRRVIEIKPPSYILLSVVVLFAFCWVFGLIALLFGLQVDSAWAAGNRQNARNLSSSARSWNIAGMIVGCGLYIGILVSSVASSAAGT